MTQTATRSGTSAESRPPRRAEAPPAHFGDYYVLRPLAAGASGSVYLAEDTLLERVVAVKFIPAGDLRSLDQFLMEARAAARIQHPNVAAIYAAGHVESWAYLVTELVRGTPLDALDKPLGWERARDIACELARGLAAAHRRGVLHCDVKPANVLVGEDGSVKIIDFGLAKTISPSGAAEAAERPIVGTPHYVPPEAWRGEELTVRSDLYSLGAIVYELCTGRAPFADVPPHLAGHVIAERDAPPLASLAAAVDPRFAAAIDRCLRREPLERQATADELIEELERARPAAPAQVPDGNPYRGLLPFQPEHRALFFGRSRDCASVLERVRFDPFVLVTGDSGVGKSSFCLAAVLPAVEDDGLAGPRAWHAVRLLPGRRPLAALASALAPDDAERAGDAMRADPAAFARELHRRLEHRGLLLFVDQLEELVTVGREEAADVARVLAELASGYPGIRILATARSDFLGQLAALPSLGSLVPRALYLLRALGEEELREAVVGPAELKGVRFEPPLADELVSATLDAHGGLPLLQFTLAELWEQRDERRALIPAAVVAKVGGVAGALARHADHVLAQLVPEQREAARRLLLRLTTPERTRNHRTREELTFADPAAEGALEALIRGRLLVVRDGSGIELAHEALLSAWGTLARWIADQSTRRALRERVAAAAAEWDRCGRAREALWGARRLADCGDLDPATLPAPAAQFLAASGSAARRAAWRTRIAVAAAAFVVVTGVTTVRLVQRHRLDSQVADRLARARASLSEAEASEAKLSSARGEAFQEFDQAHRAAGEAAWRRALQLQGATDASFAAAAERYEDAVLLAGDRADVRSAFADFLVASALHERSAVARDERIRRLRLYDPTGARLRAFQADASLSLTAPAGASVRLARVETNAAGRRVPGEAARTVSTPIQPLTLAPGTYQLSFSAPGHIAVELPLQLAPGEHRNVAVELPRIGEVPDGFAVVPGGRSWFGTASDEPIREFFGTVPLHAVETEGFLIARHETTYAEWIEFLRSLPPAERALRRPHAGGTSLSGQLELREDHGRWRLAVQAGTRPQVLDEGDALQLPRDRRARQDWLRLPVAGVSFHDARAYAAWLARTGRVPGARLCTEWEWERAARGADEREFPGGDTLASDDADFDATYGKESQAFSPDEVGSHPGSRSPFGVDDLAGNVWEWVESSLSSGEAVARGGSAWAAANTCRSVNREVPEPSFRAAVLGVRICAGWPARAQ